MNKRFGAVALSLAIALGSAGSAQASTYGLHWANRTVYVYVDSNVSSRWYINYDIAQWSKAGGINVVRTYTYSKANIKVHQKDLPAPNAAETALSWSGSTLLGADITLDSTALGLSYCSRRHIATHELGHAIGLAHNTSSSTSIMFTGYTKTCSMYPNTYDYNDLRVLYPY